MSATTIQPIGQLIGRVRAATNARADWSTTAQRVADQLRAHLPGPAILTPAQRLGSPDRAESHTLHVEPDGSFSITAVVWRPGQVTRVHDHTTWCVFGVIEGVEHEDVFDADLNLIGHSDGRVGRRQRLRSARRHSPRPQHQRRRRDLHSHLRDRHHPHRLHRPPLLRPPGRAMSVPTEVVSKAGWDAARTALLAKEETWQGAPAGLPQDRAGSWTRRSDEYTPKQLAGGRS